jgi:hypothetical protein
MIRDHIRHRGFRDVDVTDADGFVEDECLGLEDPTAPAPEFQDIRETKGYQMVDHEMPPIECRTEALLVPSVESIGPTSLMRHSTPVNTLASR